MRLKNRVDIKIVLRLNIIYSFITILFKFFINNSVNKNKKFLKKVCLIKTPHLMKEFLNLKKYKLFNSKLIILNFYNLLKLWF